MVTFSKEEITIQRVNNITLCIINDFTDTFKKLIRNTLSIVCYGPSINKPELINEYPFEQTIASFKERYSSKSDDLKTGMLGELLAHILIDNFLEELKVFSPYFNKEEGHIRKGFDILYIDTKNSCVRYGEVKSGAIHQNKTINETNLELLYNAEVDLREKLRNKERKVLWDNAKNDALLYRTLNTSVNIHSLLSKDQQTHLSKDKKVILISVCFHDINDKIDISKIGNFYKKHIARGSFLDTIIFSIQKNTLEKIEAFMLEGVNYMVTLEDIRKLKNKTEDFFILYKKLMTANNPDLSDDDKLFLLKIAILFLNQEDSYINKLGYRIILEYSTKFKDYEPLYEVAIDQGYIPIANFIENHHIDNKNTTNNFFLLWLSAFNNTFKRGDIFLSCQQKNLFNDFINDNISNQVVIAPTSYGKSELIIDKIEKNLNKNICVLVPSKALLAQTKKRLLKSKNIGKSFMKIITHPELYKGTEENILAVLTQERLQILLNRFKNLFFDCVMIDEAHNIFTDDERSILLGQVLLILKKRNSTTVFNYFSPFISDTSNLKLKYNNMSLTERSISETLKEEQFYIFNENSNNKLLFFDQYLNLSYIVEEDLKLSEFDFIIQKRGYKNIIYINSPRKLEEFALNFSKNLPDIEDVSLINEFAAIKSYTDVNYNLLKCLRKGVVYHHAGMPDIIKLYVEDLFRKNPNLKYIITTSTLLEGVNIPAEKMFILDLKKGSRYLSKSEFKNLIGRICRFSEIFNKDIGNLEYLKPKIFFVYNPIMRSGTNITKFLKNRLDLREIIDDVKNVLLEKCVTSDDNKQKLEEIQDYIENTEPETLPNLHISKIASEIGKLCYKYNVHDFNIKENEQKLILNYMQVISCLKIETISDLVDTLYSVFFKNIELKNDNAKRFQNESTRNFYKLFLEWKAQGKPFSLLIKYFISYWNQQKFRDPYVYVGKRWGKIKKPNTQGVFPLHINILEENETSLINIAILRIKEEQDFVDNFLIKYVEIFNDLNLLDINLYNSIKYGSVDPIYICLLKNGFSIELTHCLTQSRYIRYLSLDVDNCEIIGINPLILEKMKENKENEILLFEIQYHM